MNFVSLANIAGECISQGYVSQFTFWLTGVATMIGSGGLGFLASIYFFRRSQTDLIKKRDQYYRDGMYFHFGYQELNDGFLSINKPLKVFREESVERFLSDLFYDHINKEVTFECFEARIQRLYVNLDKIFLFSDGCTSTLRKIIHKAIETPVNDSQRYHVFLNCLLEIRSETELRDFLLTVRNLPKKIKSGFSF